MGNGTLINSEAIEEAVHKIDEKLAQKPEDKKLDEEAIKRLLVWGKKSPLFHYYFKK